MNTVRIGAGLIEMLERAAWQAAPNEACALLLGVREDAVANVTSAVLADNVTDGDPETSFEVDPAMHVRLQKLVREGGPEIVGVWHSHPKGPAQPSQTDQSRSVEPGWIWLITGHGGSVSATAAFFAGADDPHLLAPVAMDVLPAS